MATGCQRSQLLIKLAAHITVFLIIKHENVLAIDEKYKFASYFVY